MVNKDRFQLGQEGARTRTICSLPAISLLLMTLAA